MSAVLAYLPRGNTLSDEAWGKRHLLLQWLLLAHVPGLFLFGLARGHDVQDVAATMAVPFACLVVARLMRTRRLASFFVTAGLVYCSAALVAFSDGSIEAHFHFFIMIGFIALYQDWVPFLWNIIFTVFSHGIGSAFKSNLIFNHHAGIAHPWTWSVIHGVAVLAACVGVVIFWKQTEDEQNKTLELRERLAATELGRRRFTSDLLVNLARRNQNLLYRQLDLLNQLEEHERDPDALADLFQLDHLATRIRRNAESLLVLSGEEPARKWGRPVLLVDVVRAAIAETEDLDRVDFAVDEGLAVSGRAVADLTHMMAELIENAVHFSPPGMTVMLRTRPSVQTPGAHVLTIEDWGVGMSPQEFAEANSLLGVPRDVDLSVSQRLGLHVVARLARRYGLAVSLTPTPGGGVTAVVVLPADLFDGSGAAEPELPASWRAPASPAALMSPRVGMPAAPVEPMGRAVTFAPPMAPPPMAPPPLPPRPTTPAMARGPIEPFAPSTGLSDDWHAWWTPHQRANGHLNGSGPGPTEHPFPGRPAGPADGDWPAFPDRPAEPGGSGRWTAFPNGTDQSRPVTPDSPAARSWGAAGPGTGTSDPGGTAGTSWADDTGPSSAGGTTGGGTWTDRVEGPAGTSWSDATPGTAGTTGTADTAWTDRTAGTADTAGSSDTGRMTGTAGTTGTAEARTAEARTAEAGTAEGSGADPGAAGGDPGGTVDGVGRLNQRVPQTHLAEELRRQPEPAAEPPVIRDPLQAREALSRFQASQRAARAMLDDTSDPAATAATGTGDETGSTDRPGDTAVPGETGTTSGSGADRSD